MTALKNAKHERFAQAIAGGKPQLEAYGAAGYDISNEAAAAASASRLAKNADVIKRVASINGDAAERTTISIVAAVEELGKLGFSNMKRFRDFAFTGDLDDLDEADAAALRSVTVDTYTDGHGDDAREVKRVKFEIHDKRGPLVDIIRHLGGFKSNSIKDKADGTLAGGAALEASRRPEDVSELELARRIAFALEKAARSREAKAKAPAPKPIKPKKDKKP